MLVLKVYPAFGVGILALTFARQAALPAVGVEHWPSGMPVHFAEVAFDVGENFFVVFHDVAVGVDDEL